MNKKMMPYLYGLGSFLAAWQATEFSTDFKAVMGAVTCLVLGYGSPKVDKTK